MPTLEERVAELEALIGASKKGSEIDSTTYSANNHLVVHSQSDDKIKKLPPTLLPFLSSEKETYYGNFRYLTGIPNDLDYTFVDDFTLAKTIENKYYFISKLGDLNNHKIYLNNSGEFFRLNEANRVAEKKAWEIEGLTGTFTPNQLFKFNRWIESGYWKSPKVVVVAPHETFNFPKSFKDDVFIVEVYNDKGIPQTNGTFRLGGYLSASHQTILSAKKDSDGGNYGTAAHQFLIINQRKQTVIQYFDSFDDFPDPGDPNLLYVEEENDTTWFWSPGDNDYQSLGEVVRGELIDSTTFEDILGVPVMPSPEKTYIDVTVTPKVEYLWDGAQYVPIGSASSNQIIFYNSAGPPAVVGQSGILYIQIETGAAFVWNGGWVSIGGGYDWTYLGNQKHLKYNSTTQRPENSNIEDTATGVSVDGGVTLSDFGGTPVNGQLYRVGDSLRFKDGTDFVHTLTGLNLKEDSSNKSTEFTPDELGVKFPTINAVSNFFLNELSLIPINITIEPVNSYINNSGSVLPSVNWRTSEPINVVESEVYIYYGVTDVPSSVARAVYGYGTSNQVLIGIINGENGVEFTIPSGVTTIRLCSMASYPMSLFKKISDGGAPKVKEELLPDYLISKQKTLIQKSWGAIGHSIWASDGTLNGIQTLVQRLFEFAEYEKYAYSGNSLSAASTSVSTCILQTSKTDTWTSKDIFTYDSITNDFKLNRPIGTTSDFIDNTGVATYYGALRVLHEKLSSMNANYYMICANALKRDNASYTSWSANTEGHTLKDYSDALEWVANRLSWRFINQFRDSTISDINLATYTSDGLHPNNSGYLRIAPLWIDEFRKIALELL